MKKLSLFISALTILFVLQSNIVAGEIELEDSITLRARNPGIITLTKDQVRQMLQKADFEGHGFQKQESRTLLSANSSAYMTNIFYYKEVNCSQLQVMQVLMEAERLLPGSMRPSGNSRAKVAREMKVFSGSDPIAICKAGVEIHFKPTPRGTSKTMTTLRRSKRDIIIITSSCDIIIIKDPE